MYIYPVNKTIVTAPDNFEFICNTNIDINVILLIDGMAANSTKFDRIRTMNKTTAKDTVYQYTFMNTISTDNGTTFSCIAINSTPFQSDNLTLEVYCELVYVSVCLPACLSVCVYLYMYLCVCLLTHLPTYLPTCLSVCLSACFCVLCVSEYLYICPPTYLPSTYSYLPNLSVCLSACLPVCLSVRLPPSLWCVY